MTCGLASLQYVINCTSSKLYKKVREIILKQNRTSVSRKTTVVTKIETEEIEGVQYIYIYIDGNGSIANNGIACIQTY